MELYYTNQASSLPYFFGHFRRSGSGFGALASGICRIVLSPAQKFILPTAETVGEELLLQSVPELVNVVSKRNSQRRR